MHKLLASNHTQFCTIFNIVDDSCKYLKLLFLKSTLNFEKINILKESFFIFLGNDFITLFDTICLNYKIYLKQCEKAGEMPSILDPTYQMFMKIDSFLSFKDLEYTEEMLIKDRKHPYLYKINRYSMSK